MRRESDEHVLNSLSQALCRIVNQKPNELASLGTKNFATLAMSTRRACLSSSLPSSRADLGYSPTHATAQRPGAALPTTLLSPAATLSSLPCPDAPICLEAGPGWRNLCGTAKRWSEPALRIA